MATVYYMELITKMTDASVDQEHPQIILKSIPGTPDRTAYIIGKSEENPLPQLLQACKELESMGADFITMPCVTAQFFYEKLAESVEVPLLSLCGNVAEEIAGKQIKKVGILATSGTIESKVLENTFGENGIETVIPDAFHQEMVMDIIYRQIKKGREIRWEMFDEIVEYLYSNGAEKIILGCTELSLLKKEKNMDGRIVDVLEVLAQKAVLASGAGLKKEYQEIIR